MASCCQPGNAFQRGGGTTTDCILDFDSLAPKRSKKTILAVMQGSSAKDQNQYADDDR